MPPLQNRVLPTGEIVAHPARGLLMGNRGCIHTPERRLATSRWRSPMWISCLLWFGNRRRDVMPPGRWTALFFLDEATALAAGHRPCGYCRREDHLAFGEAWRDAHHLPARPLARAMDLQLHRERVDRRTRGQITRPARLGGLPDGAIVRHGDAVALLDGGRLLTWSPAGYGTAVAADPAVSVQVLTPPAIVRALAAGYRPLVHPSAASATLRTLRPPPGYSSDS